MWTRSFVVLLGVITTVHCRPAHDTTGLATSTPLANNNSTATRRNYVVVETASANCVKCALKPTPCDLDKEPKLKELPAAGAAGVDEFVNTNDSGGKNDGDYDHHGPIATLLPAVHWDCDTQPATNVVPIPPEKGSQMYYGVNGTLLSLFTLIFYADHSQRSYSTWALRLLDLLFQEALRQS